MTARQLADRLKWDINIVSSQLNRLQQHGLVEKVQPAQGGRSAFQIGDRFFSIWYLMRASRRVRRKLTWMISFMQLFSDTNKSRFLAKKLNRNQKLYEF
ncbi:hypothetical protein [Candidatus Electronema sp. JM]|uniref:hypothetical protein n=1 Tax=Candidatus Electronema sp. JM TaxID=3401571 RepID=UPI003AA83FBE